MAIRVGKGRSEVVIDGAIADDIEQEIRSLLGPVIVEMEAEANKILEGVKERWPVKSGRSRDSWRAELRVHPDTFEVEVALVSDVQYTRYIKSTKEAKKDNKVRLRSPLQTEVRTPAREAVKLLKERLPAILARHLEEEVF